jgi:enterochelin esterase family protein
MRKIFLAITFALIAFTTSAQDSDQIRQWMRNMSRVEEKTIHSEILNADRNYTVYLPAGYANNTDKQYPVLYLLHGMNGTNKDWAGRGHLQDVMDQLRAAGEVCDMIVISPNAGGNIGEGVWNGYFDMEGWAYERFFFEEFLPAVEKEYRIKGEKGSRAIAGLSMGGGHTTAVTGLYPDLFDYICPLSCGMRDTEEAVAALQGIKKAGYKLYWVGCGDADFAYPGTKVMDEMLTRLDMPHTMFISGGGHTWSNWRYYLNTFPRLLFK